jgi:hypothetical protein
MFTKPLAAVASLAAGACVLAVAVAGTAAPALAATPKATPRYAVQPTPRKATTARASTLPTWNFSYTYQGTPYQDAFIGAAPTTGASTTLPVEIIPVTLKLGTFTASPEKKLADGKTVVQNTVASPLFAKSVDFVQGGTNVGTTQYIDAFQRASLWGTVKSHRGYHVLLGKPVVEPVQTLTVPAGSGTVGSAFGVKVVFPDIDWFDASVQPLLTSLGLPADSLPIFVTTQTYLTQGGGCCIGGYHSFNGSQIYSEFSYIQKAGAFSQDVSALSHEIGETVDDPFTNNPSPCGIYEVGDPLEDGANYGDVPYTVAGVTYNLQDLVTPTYFGAPASTSLLGWQTFQGQSLSVCQNGS